MEEKSSPAEEPTAEELKRAEQEYDAGWSMGEHDDAVDAKPDGESDPAVVPQDGPPDGAGPEGAGEPPEPGPESPDAGGEAEAGAGQPEAPAPDAPDPVAKLQKDLGLDKPNVPDEPEPEQEAKPPESPPLPEEVDKAIQSFEDLDPEAGKALRTGVRNLNERVATIELREQAQQARAEHNERIRAAQQQLAKRHPDFMEVGASEGYQRWLGNQADYVRQAHGSEDPDTVADVLDRYKREEGVSGPSPSRTAAKAELARGTTVKPVAHGGDRPGPAEGSFDYGWNLAGQEEKARRKRMERYRTVV